MPRSNKKKNPFKPPPRDPTLSVTYSTTSVSNEAELVKNETSLMVRRAMLSAGRHDISLKHGSSNEGLGNCAFESAISNVNDRDCFTEKFPLSPIQYRRIWMNDMKIRVISDPTWNIYSIPEWESGWNEMMESGVYERDLYGDLMVLGIACGLRKNILIFNTNLLSPHDPIYVCDPRRFGVEPDTEIPVVLAYNLYHYESMHPIQLKDNRETSRLVSSYLKGTYQFGKNDLPMLLSEGTDMMDHNFDMNIVNKAGVEAEQSTLPEHLRNRRPNEMTKGERKEYNKRKKLFGESFSSFSENIYQKENDNEGMDKNKDNSIEDKIKQKKEQRRIYMKNYRAQEKSVDKQRRKKQHMIHMKNYRAQESSADKKKRKEQNMSHMRNCRAQENSADKQKRKEQNMSHMRNYRAEESSVAKKKRKEQNMSHKRNYRAQENSADKQKRQEKDKLEKRKKVPTCQYLGRHALNVLAGEQIVPELINTDETIGHMDKVCIQCKARKFKNETSTLCCNDGKVDLPLFSTPPDFIQSLLTEQTNEAVIFRENSRSFNNALALSSIVVNERKFANGFNPSVIFEGKVTQLYGPLLPENGEEPKFAQLYVHDPSTEHTMRVQNMSLPTTLSKRHVQIITETIKKLQILLREINPFVKDFLHICEIPDEDLKYGKIVLTCNKSDLPKDAHERRYNPQTSLSEVSILTNSVPGDLVMRKRGGGLQQIYDLHPDAQPLHFVLLFPYGTSGYSAFLRHKDSTKRISPREFFAFHLNMRNTKADFLFKFCRLFQEYICLAFTTIESQKLKFQKNNQAALRADTYKNVKDVLRDRVPISDRYSKDDHQLKIGRRIVLSKSFIGSPRWYHSKFQDGMAICRKYHKPDFFITFTCNPNWVEIQKELEKGETAQNRPDLVARVFKLKKDQLLKDITDRNIFGKVPAFLWVIEFQKRGLPHMHLLVILKESDRISLSEEIDDVISAHLPPDPALFSIGSEERKQAERLESIVIKNMIHGPCGNLNPKSPCMVDGKCSKGYPKPFCDKTIIHPDNTYPDYKRLAPSNGGRSIMINTRKGTFEIDNKWVVPYSPFLCLRFDCHINIEICMSPLASKYLFKYVTKGEDRAMVRMEINGDDQQIDEIGDYIDLRSVGSSEASWHIFNFNIAKNYPAVYALRIHLEDEQQVVFDMETAEESVENQRCTELTEFFVYNEEHPETNVTYSDFPENFVWKDKKWHARKRFSGTIGRINVVNPVAGDVYYLRILLHHDHCKGKISFEDMRTVGGDLLETYQDVCRSLGLLQDDKEWDQALSDASVIKMPSALRELYTTILMFCMPSNPQELFDNHFMEWTDDFRLDARKRSVELSESQLRTKTLLDIRQRLNGWERDLKHFRLTEPTDSEMKEIELLEPNMMPVIIREELDFNVADLENLVDERKVTLTQSQGKIFDRIMEAVQTGDVAYIFIDARGGTGKTYLLNAILAAVRSQQGGSIALAVGSTGIASNLLHLGRTLHSRFKVPLTIDKDSVCNIQAQSNLAQLIRMSKLIVWDEAPMNHRYQLEALDRSLRDISGIDRAFGGKSMVLSGDFRQCLPVIPNSNRAEVVGAALNRSHLWNVFEVMHLEENMRVQMSNDPDAKDFDEYTLKLGDGMVETIENTDLVEIPESMCMEIKERTVNSPNAVKDSMKSLADHVYPRLNSNFKKTGWMNGRAILAPTNREVDEINNLISETFPGSPIVLTSSDDLIDPNDFQRYNIEYLNSLSPTGLPVHRLFIKPGMPLMLMRNLNPKMGLCNGTRLIFLKVHNIYLLECSISGGEHDGRKVLIPRITLKPKAKEYSFEWCRRQFPVRVAFAMTINKSQGQTLSNVGIWLNEPCFSHGQLYVCISRVGSPKNIKFAIRKKEGYKWNFTNNVVYREVLI